MQEIRIEKYRNNFRFFIFDQQGVGVEEEDFFLYSMVGRLSIFSFIWELVSVLIGMGFGDAMLCVTLLYKENCEKNLKQKNHLEHFLTSTLTKPAKWY